MRTRLTELLNIKYPIMQGGMAWVADASLAGAVSAGGGLGIIAGGSAPAEVIEKEIAAVQGMTDRPFGVNIMLLSPNAEDLAQLVIDRKVPVVTTGSGSPAAYIGKWKAAGIIVLPVVASVAYAVRLERMGADAVIAEGAESGGHIGEATTMALVPQVADAVQVPVVAAGGIADGRGLAASFMLGACGAQIGTRFLACTECTVHENYKEKVVKAKDSDSVVTGRATGHPVRGLKNRLTRAFKELEAKDTPLEEYEALGSDRLRQAVKEGDVRNGSVMAGQIAGLVKEIKPAAEILREINDEAEKLLLSAPELVKE